VVAIGDFGWENLKEREHYDDLGIDDRTKLKRTFVR
jgi:hypothetical protein